VQRARIYKPTRTAMQQGRAKTRAWVLELEPTTPRWRDPLMGWTSAAETTAQVRLSFDSKEDAIAYAERHGIDCVVSDPQQRVVRPKSYADNFRWSRPE
jgi:hypothetical protein